MKKLFLMLFFTFMLACLISADSKQYDEACEFIKAGKLDKAETIADSIMKKNPNNPESYTLKSSILCSRELQGTGLETFVNTDESIYETAIGFTDTKPVWVTSETAEKSEKYLLKAIKVGPKWETAYLTICYMYSISCCNNTDKLIEMLKTMKAMFPKDKELRYSMTDYAVNLKDRGSIKESEKVYKAIISMYPNESNFVNDLAWLYFEEGNIGAAAEYMKKCETLDNIDDRTANTMVNIFTVSGDYDHALKAVKLYSKLRKNNYWLAYKGMYEKYMGKKEWKETLKKYLSDTKHTEGAVKFCKEIIDLKDDSDIKSLYSEDADYTLIILLDEYNYSKHPDNLDIGFSFANNMTFRKNYKKAIEIFSKMIKTINMTKAQALDVDFYFAWALQASGNTEEADKYWKEELDNEDFYKMSAANYFLGKNIYKSSKDKAKEYFEKISGKAGDSKYATLAKNRLDHIDDPSYEFRHLMKISDDAVELHPTKK